MTSARDDRGFEELDRALDAHRENRRVRAKRDVTVQRRSYQVRQLLEQRLEEVLPQFPPNEHDIATAVRLIVRAMQFETTGVPLT